MNDEDESCAAAALDGEATACDRAAARRYGWLSGVLGRLFTLGDLADSAQPGGWRG